MYVGHKYNDVRQRIWIIWYIGIGVITLSIDFLLGEY